MRTLLLVSLAGIVGVAVGQQVNCEQTRFLACTSSLATYLGVDAQAVWYSPDQLTDILRDLYRAGGSNGIAQTCNYLLLFYQCLGQFNLGLCLGPIGWISRGKSPADAYAFEGILSLYRFQCGAGFYAAVNQPNGTCVQSTYSNYRAEIDQFYSSYQLNIANDPNNACTYQGQLSTGIGNIFQQGPCRIPFGTQPGYPFWFGCEGSKEFTLAQFRHCANVNPCYTQPTSEEVERVAQYVRKDANGEPEFLLPETWTKDARGKTVLEPARWI